jgi:hypothetical protein
VRDRLRRAATGGLGLTQPSSSGGGQPGSAVGRCGPWFRDVLGKDGWEPQAGRGAEHGARVAHERAGNAFRGGLGDGEDRRVSILKGVEVPSRTLARPDGGLLLAVDEGALVGGGI